MPSAIHVAPEALDGGLIAKLHDGDLIRVDAREGRLEVLTDGVADRIVTPPDLTANTHGIGREMFDLFRQAAGPATSGACCLT